VDHVTPHKGDLALFFNRENWQSLCKRCHDHVKANIERNGTRPGTRLDGTPVDPAHAWNQPTPG
jgi:5-methylcytosine-specific restriction endonuclease McrA